jgi:hypothetical protein
MRVLPHSLRQAGRFLLLAISAGALNQLRAQPASGGAPAITVPPASQTALIGTDPYFSVSATGEPPLHYTWKKDGTPVPGANAAELDLKGAPVATAGNYTVTVSNDVGAVTSDAATLTVVAPATAQPPPLPSIPGTVFNVTTYGAKADGATDNTAAIQAAIDAAAVNGGIVKIPAADKPYLCGPLTVRSNINLQIDGGATLQLLPYMATDASPAYPRAATNFISGNNLHNFAITGQGVIEGQGGPWWDAFRAERVRRPYLIRLGGCDHVLVTGITLQNSPMFHLACNGANITVVGLTIHAPGNSPNTDAIDPGGQHILIQNCNLSIGDDNVAVKAGGIYCADITIANCTIGEGHGISVGGQSNRGLDGMVVKDCVFNGTVSGLRLKADATEGGLVQNITYSNLTMNNVQYPIVFYSYYKPVGNPGQTGKNQTTPAQVNDWNANPPNSLDSRTLSGWRNITIDNLTSTGAKAYNIIWGLPLADYLIANVTLHNVHLSGGPGFEIYDATNVQVTGNSDIGSVITDNALVLVKQPESQSVTAGANATFSVSATGASGMKNTAPKFQWNLNGAPLADGPRSSGATISGATTATLTITNVRAGDAGNYTATVSNTLDGYDVAAGALAPDSIPVSATSSPAVLSVK